MPALLASTEQCTRSFLFERDSFAFANQLVWEYRFDPATRSVSIAQNPCPPTYSHRCFVLVRAARKFYYHARFDPELPEQTAEVYRGLVRAVMVRSSRRPSSEALRVVIPGFAGLRAFSHAHEPLLKATCGRPWRSYLVRSHWRMVFPTPEWHQRRIARQLLRRVREGAAPAVHLFRFPKVTINHGILLFDVQETAEHLRFEGYDPNLPDHPVQLTYDRSREQFFFPATLYWAGGLVSVTEIFYGVLY